MEMNGRKTGFWSQGFSIFKDDLARKEEAMITPLKKEMQEAGDAARKLQLKQEIKAIKDEFRIRRRNARHSLFLKT